MLASRGAVIRALGSHLIDIIDGAEAYRARIEHSVDELTAVLAGFSLTRRDLHDVEIFVVERHTGNLRIVVDDAGDHLDQRRLAGSGRAIANERKEEAAKLNEGVELTIEIVGHQHLR